MENRREVVRDAFGGGYRARANRRRSGTSAIAGAGTKGLTQKLRNALNGLSTGAQRFDELINKYQLLPRNASLTYGMEWQAQDVLSNGLFDHLPTIIRRFIESFFNLPGGVSELRYHLNPLAQGEASAKEFYKPYQGVPFYFMLAEVPFSDLRPDMRIDVTLTRPGGTSGLFGALGFKGDASGDMEAAASAELYYYRQPDDDENEYFRAVDSGPLLPLLAYLWGRPGLKRLSNWYGQNSVATAYWADGSFASQIIEAPDDYAEFDNAFNPFWEVRLTGSEG